MPKFGRPSEEEWEAINEKHDKAKERQKNEKEMGRQRIALSPEDSNKLSEEAGRALLAKNEMDKIREELENMSTEKTMIVEPLPYPVAKKKGFLAKFFGR